MLTCCDGFGSRFWLIALTATHFLTDLVYSIRAKHLLPPNSLDVIFQGKDDGDKVFADTPTSHKR